MKFAVVPLRVTADAQHCHQVFLKEHFIRLIDPNKPKGRTLFLLNIPPYITVSSLEKFFQTIGDVEFVAFAEKAGREETDKWRRNLTEFSNNQPSYKFKVAYIIFKKTSSVVKALEIREINLFNSQTNESYIETGMQLWHSQYQKYVLDIKETQAHIDAYMLAYDEQERISLEAAKTGPADEDGWVTVGKHGHYAGFEQNESVIEKVENKMTKSKKNKVLKNFYTFQIRESKMKNIIELREKFEADKKKIEILKQKRRFKPF